MIIALLAALCIGAAMTTGVLWLTGSNGNQAATLRLSQLRNEGQSTGALSAIFALRKRAKGVNFGGINVVNSNVVANWTRDLERAGLTLNVREYFILRVTGAVVLAALVFMLAPLKILAVAGLPLGFLVVGFWVKRRINSRQQKLESQLVELLQMLASGLRAGFGLLQAIEAATEQLAPPVSVELRRFMRDTAMGASVESALESMNERIGSSDWDIVITAIMIQRSVGGNLAEILDNVAHTMRERERIKGEIRTLTSQQRMTGYVIGGIPIGLGIIFSMLNWDFTSLLFTEPLGQAMLAGGAVLWVTGFMVIRKIVNIEV
ncbi:MAG: type II secretion system F family protein [Dehalococcoidia bacterium]